jgi:alanine racemase
VLVGEQGSERIAIEELAEKAGTINYELACAFGMRLPRTYR